MNLIHNRRTFLRGAGIAAASALAPAISEEARATPLEVKPSPVHLSCCSYTLRNFSRARAIEYARQLKLTTINLKDVKDHLPSTSPEAEMQALDDWKAAGITPTAVGTIYFAKNEDADIREKFEYAKRAGVRVIVTGDPDLATLPRLERFVKEYDIAVAIHNHGPEDKIYHSPLDVLKYVKDMDVRMGCCIDVGHCMRAGTDVVQAIHEVGPRLHDMHIKDLAKADSKESQVAVGEGIMPVRGIFQALIDTGYKGYVDLEYEIFPEDPMPGVVESFAYMRGVLAGMGYRG